MLFSFFVLVLLGGGGLLFWVFGVRFPPPGPAVASTSVVSRQAFELGWVSDGREMRALLDWDCDFSTGACEGSLPIRGAKGVSVAGAAEASHEIDTASGVSSGAGSSVGGRETQAAYNLFRVPAHPAGTALQITGVLSAPSCCALRVYVAE